MHHYAHVWFGDVTPEKAQSALPSHRSPSNHIYGGRGAQRQRHTYKDTEKEILREKESQRSKVRGRKIDRETKRNR